MNVTFAIHLEPADQDVVWWAETDGLPGFSAAAPTLRELRTLIEEAVRLHLGTDAEIGLELITAEDGAGWTAFLRGLVARGLTGVVLDIAIICVLW